MKRIAIFFFYDKNGNVDRYNEVLLDGLQKHIDKLIIVCNGSLSNEGKEILNTYGEVIVRENKGFDVWAYKTGIEHIYDNELSNYDELILFNNTIYGPIDSFEKTFEKSKKWDNLDFWGITKYFKYKHDPFGCIKYGYIPDHIQSHFIAIRKNMFMSKDFKTYWDEMPEINNYLEAIGKHEAIFTKHFADLGYKWNTTVEMDDLRDYSGYPLMMCPKLLVEKYDCPIIKRRSFFHDVNDILHNTTGEQSSELFEHIDKHTSYETDLILDNLLKNYNQYDIFKHLNLTYILPSNIKYQETKSKTALVYHVYFPDLLEQTTRYAASFSPNYDVYITTDTEEKKAAIKEAFEKIEFNHFEVRLIENRGRDVSSLLVGVKDIIMDYEVVCFAHDKKTAQVKPYTIGDSFAYKCLTNVLYNKNYVENIIATFEDNPRLGILSPPEPNHSNFNATIGSEWGPNYKNTVKLAKELGINVSIDKTRPPIAPFGTMFWFRPESFKPLYDKDWQYDDFPPEPNKVDGSLLHAIERLYPFAAQQSGYYPAICMTDKFAAIEYGNLKHYVREFNLVALNHGYAPEHVTMFIGLDDDCNKLDHYERLFERKFFKFLMIPYRIIRWFYRKFRAIINLFRGKDAKK